MNQRSRNMKNPSLPKGKSIKMQTAGLLGGRERVRKAYSSVPIDWRRRSVSLQIRGTNTYLCRRQSKAPTLTYGVQLPACLWGANITSLHWTGTAALDIPLAWQPSGDSDDWSHDTAKVERRQKQENIIIFSTGERLHNSRRCTRIGGANNTMFCANYPRDIQEVQGCLLFRTTELKWVFIPAQNIVIRQVLLSCAQMLHYSPWRRGEKTTNKENNV